MLVTWLGVTNDANDAAVDRRLTLVRRRDNGHTNVVPSDVPVPLGTQGVQLRVPRLAAPRPDAGPLARSPMRPHGATAVYNVDKDVADLRARPLVPANARPQLAATVSLPVAGQQTLPSPRPLVLRVVLTKESGLVNVGLRPFRLVEAVVAKVAVVAAFVAAEPLTARPLGPLTADQTFAGARIVVRLSDPGALEGRHADVVRLPRVRGDTAIGLDAMPFAGADNAEAPTFADTTSTARLTQGGVNRSNIRLPLRPAALRLPDNADQLLPRNVDLVADVLRDTRPRAPDTARRRVRVRLLFNKDHVRQIATRSPRNPN